MGFSVLTLVIIGVVATIVLLAILAGLTKRAEFPELNALVKGLDHQQAEQHHREALHTGARFHEKKPDLAMGRKEFEYYVSLAILTKDRMHKFEGLPNGPKIRKRWRGEIIDQMKQIATDKEEYHG